MSGQDEARSRYLGMLNIAPRYVKLFFLTFKWFKYCVCDDDAGAVINDVVVILEESAVIDNDGFGCCVGDKVSVSSSAILCPFCLWDKGFFKIGLKGLVLNKLLTFLFSLTTLLLFSLICCL